MNIIKLESKHRFAVCYMCRINVVTSICAGQVIFVTHRWNHLFASL